MVTSPDVGIIAAATTPVLDGLGEIVVFVIAGIAIAAFSKPDKHG